MVFIAEEDGMFGREGREAVLHDVKRVNGKVGKNI